METCRTKQVGDLCLTWWFVWLFTSLVSPVEERWSRNVPPGLILLVLLKFLIPGSPATVAAFFIHLARIVQLFAINYSQKLTNHSNKWSKLINTHPPILLDSKCDFDLLLSIFFVPVLVRVKRRYSLKIVWSLTHCLKVWVSLILFSFSKLRQ